MDTKMLDKNRKEEKYKKCETLFLGNYYI